MRRLAVCCSACTATVHGAAKRLRCVLVPDGRVSRVQGAGHERGQALPGVEPGRTHVYRVGAVDQETGLEDNILTHTGLWKGTLKPAFRVPDPNPARGPMSFRYFIPGGASITQVKVTVFNVAGRRIKDLQTRELSTDGEGIAEWNLDDARGHRVRAGVYFAHLKIGGGGEGLEFVQRFVVLP